MLKRVKGHLQIVLTTCAHFESFSSQIVVEEHLDPTEASEKFPFRGEALDAAAVATTFFLL